MWINTKREVEKIFASVFHLKLIYFELINVITITDYFKPDDR